MSIAIHIEQSGACLNPETDPPLQMRRPQGAFPGLITADGARLRHITLPAD